MFLYTIRLLEFITKTGIYSFEERLNPKDAVIVFYDNKEYVGEILYCLGEVEDPSFGSLKRILRRASLEEESKARTRGLKKKEIFYIVKERIKAHELPMKLIQVDFADNPERVVCFFVAEGRIDFRELVKDLAHRLMNRVELRQIGVRDEIKIVKGIGPCGKIACCCEFLEDFSPISVKIAKEQGLILNPTKISGLCGRLMCCLRFESDFYSEVIKKFPEIGSKVKTKMGDGEVVGINAIKSTVIVEFKNGWQKEVSLEDIINGAEDRTRTDTDVSPLDPESSASTNSATSAQPQSYYNSPPKIVKEE